MGKRRLTRTKDAKEKRRARSAWITWAVVGGLVLVIGGFVAYLMTQGSAQTARTGSPAPDFTLRLLNGQSVTLSSLRGQPVLINFWHSTCPHCQREAPVLARVYEKYHSKGFELLSVNATWDKDAPARKFVEDHRLPFPVGRDSSGTIGGAYRVDATPASFFIDKKGVLIERVNGSFEANAEGEFSRRIEKLLAQ